MNRILTTAGCMLAVMLVLASCAKDDSAPTAPGPTSEEYVPLAIGNQWTYTFNDTDSVTYKVVGDTNAFGTSYRLLKASGALTRSAVLRRDDLLIKGMGYLNMDADSIATLVDLSKGFNGAWASYVSRAIQMCTMKERDIPVTVPAGTFDDVLHVAYNTGYFIGPQFVAISSGEFYWSRSVGVIKHVMNVATPRKSVVMELKSYTLH